MAIGGSGRAAIAWIRDASNSPRTVIGVRSRPAGPQGLGAGGEGEWPTLVETDVGARVSAQGPQIHSEDPAASEAARKHLVMLRHDRHRWNLTIVRRYCDRC